MRIVIESASYVVGRAKHVSIDAKALIRLADHIGSNPIRVPRWDYTHHYFDATEKTLFYLFELDTLNFCFWPSPGKRRWAITYEGKRLSGYLALATALKQAFEQGLPLHDPSYLASMKMADLRHILNGQGDLQLMRHRLSALKELGSYLMQKWKGSPGSLIKACKGSAVSLARRIATELDSFRDMALYHGREVFFYKRAQILAADIYGAFQGRDWGNFHDMDQLTAFADYKLPQVLRHLCVLKYSEKLAAKIDSKILIPKGSNEEIEIRAHTIWAVDLLCSELSRMGKDVRAFELDWILWNMGQEAEYRKKPYHRTVTIFY